MDDLETRMAELERRVEQLVDLLAVMGGLLAALPPVDRPVPA